MKQLIFVYNAGSGLFNLLTGFTHKIISPSTYACELCALTYDNFTMKKDWQLFIDQLPVDTVFTYKNEWQKEHPEWTEFPAAFIKNNEIELLASAYEINICPSLAELKELIMHKLVLYDQHHHSGIQ